MLVAPIERALGLIVLGTRPPVMPALASCSRRAATSASWSRVVDFLADRYAGEPDWHKGWGEVPATV